MKAVKIVYTSSLITILLACFYPVSSLRGDVASLEVLKIVTRIEEQLSKEERIRQLTDMVRIESTLDNINKKLDRLIDGIGRNPSARISSSSDLQHVSGFDPSLNSIDDRLARMENALDKVEIGFTQADFSKLEDIDKRSSQLSSELNQKLRKMMNIITALYEMNKEMKTNFGGRSDVQQEAATSQASSTSFAADFLIENLEELERKIKEQFSVLGNEIRTEITGLKIVASSVSDGCDKSLDFFEETPEEFGRSSGKRPPPKKTVANRNQQPGAGRSTAESNTLDTLMQSLGRTTREIREEIHQGIQTIDKKLSNFTQMSCGGNSDDLQTSASHPIGTRVSRDFQIVPEQVLDNEEQGRPLECTRVSKTTVSPKSCAELRLGGANCDGVYVIFPKNIRAVRVYCDMTTEGGGWTLLMRRGDFGSKMTTFHKNWLSYKNGFGDVEGEFWLGNEVFHLLTSQEANKLRVHLESFDGASTDMTYSTFSVSNETDNYRLLLGPSVGVGNAAANSLRYHSNHPFSTFDKKNDNFEQNCAATYKGGWWFNGCYFGFLTGEYFRPEEKRENWQGMLWYDWKGNAALKGAYMMTRPKDFTIY